VLRATEGAGLSSDFDGGKRFGDGGSSSIPALARCRLLRRRDKEAEAAETTTTTKEKGVKGRKERAGAASTCRFLDAKSDQS
jgi:hypothetical protein